ncbi:transglutaminase domain-containing protein [Candidatus Woesearchaeota archaeon]|nr:transglutaminase domain-containing protein [Candidatus Woesearchaeota archaeon]
MKKRIFLILFLLILPILNAETSDRVFLVDNLLIDLRLYSEINLIRETPKSNVEYVSAELSFFPRETWRQDVIELKTTPLAMEKHDSFLFRWDYPEKSSLDYELESEIKTYNKFRQVNNKITFPVLNLEEKYQEYLLATEKIDLTPEIINLASSLAEGEDDLYKVAFKLAEWTHSNIEYSLSTLTAEATQKASWVLENKKGVCDEITNLFIALCRSLGIPARFVSGISYTNSELFENEWGLHGWAEVYFPDCGWVPFDVSYSQIGFLDATHIKLKDSVDSEKSSTKFEWKSYDTDLEAGKLFNKADILGMGNELDGYIDIDANLIRDDVDFSSYNLLEVTLKNKRNYYVSSELIISKPKEVEIIDGQKKLILIKPNEEKQVFWILKVPETLKKNYLYKFPIVITDSLNKTYVTSFISEEGKIKYSYDDIIAILSQKKEQETKVYSKNIDISCDYPNKVKVNETFKISCTLKNTGNIILSDVSVCLDNDCEKINLPIFQEKTTVFLKEFNEIGEKAFTVSAKNQDINKAEFLTAYVVDDPRIEISELEFPGTVNYEDIFDVEFDLLKTSYSTPEKLEIRILFNEQEQLWSMDELSSHKPFKVNVEGSLLYMNNNKFRIIVKYYDRDNNEFIETKEFFITLNEPTLWQKIQIYLNKAGRWLEKLVG